MATAKTDLELRLLAALRRIAAYEPPSKLRRAASRDFGLEAEEAIEMAYENVIAEAKAAIRGVRLPATQGTSLGGEDDGPPIS